MRLYFRSVQVKCVLMLACSALILSRMTRADSQPVDSPPHYTITKVQGLAQTFNAILPGKEFLACNERGQVAGVQNVGAVSSNAAVFHAAIWQQGHLISLGVPQGYRHSYASAINNAGQVVGWAVRSDEKRVGSVRAWIWDKQGFHLLPLLPGTTDSAATAVNDRGQVVGTAYKRDGLPGQLNWQTPCRGFVWQDGKMADLGTPNGEYPHIIPTAINATGEIAGQATGIKPLISSSAFLWRNGAIQLLNQVTTSTEEIGAGYVNALNNRGQIIGLGSIGVNMAGDILHPFLWDSGKLSRLQITGAGINNRGNVVGTLADKEGHLRAALRANDQAYDLNTLLPGGSGWRLLSASSINNKGEILGNGVYKGKPCVYLLTPAPTVGLHTPKTPADLVPYTLTYLDALEGYATQANAINDAGDVVGDAHLTPDTQDNLKHACLWHNGKLIDLGEGRAFDINNQGQIVGVQNQNAFLYQNGKMQRLVVPGAVNSEAIAINEQGQIAGTFQTADQRQHGFLYSQGTFHDLGADTQATALSSRGVVAGIAGPHVMGGTVGHGAGLYRNGKWVALRRPIENTSDQDTGPMYPTAVSDQGDVLGDYWYEKKIVDVERVGFDSFTSMFLWRKDTERNLNGAARDLLNKIQEGKPYPLVNAKHFCTSYWLPDQNGKARNVRRLLNVKDLLTIRCVNHQGQAVGYTGFNGYTRAFLLTPTVKTGAPSPHASVPPSSTVRYTVTCLDALSSEPLFFPTVVGAINNRGQVCGWIKTTQGKRHACLWEQGRITDLGTLGGDNSEALAINDLGQVTGWADTSKMYVDFTSTPVRRAFLWQSGKMTDLGTLSGDLHSAGLSINNRGQVFGQAIGFPEPVDLDTGQRPEAIRTFLWHNGKLRAVNTPLGMRRINIRGNGAGWEEIKSSPATYRVVIWGKGGKTALPAFGSGKTVVAASINDMGQVLTQTSQGDNPAVTTLWTGRHWQMVGRGLLGNRLNNKGQVVGHTEGKPERQSAFVWQNGTRTDLNSLLPNNSGWTLREAVSINDHGQIVGTGMYQGQSHAFLLTPVQG